MARGSKSEVLAGPVVEGECNWCYREGVPVQRHRSGGLQCSDRDECRVARTHGLIIGGKRPQSWYLKLANGHLETRREARRVGVTNERIKELVEGMGLEYSVKESNEKDKDDGATDTDTNA